MPTGEEPPAHQAYSPIPHVLTDLDLPVRLCRPRRCLGLGYAQQLPVLLSRLPSHPPGPAFLHPSACHRDCSLSPASLADPYRAGRGQLLLLQPPPPTRAASLAAPVSPFLSVLRRTTCMSCQPLRCYVSFMSPPLCL